MNLLWWMGHCCTAAAAAGWKINVSNLFIWSDRLEQISIDANRTKRLKFVGKWCIGQDVNFNWNGGHQWTGWLWLHRYGYNGHSWASSILRRSVHRRGGGDAVENVICKRRLRCACLQCWFISSRLQLVEGLLGLVVLKEVSWQVATSLCVPLRLAGPKTRVIYANILPPCNLKRSLLVEQWQSKRPHLLASTS